MRYALSDVSIVVLGLLGFFVAFYIWNTKRQNKKLLCIVGDSCNYVVRSKYSHIFGVSNEFLGMLYYVLMFLVFAFGSYNILLLLTCGAAIFSTFLLLIQIFKLKEWCEWCIASSMISIVIFLIVWL